MKSKRLIYVAAIIIFVQGLAKPGRSLKSLE